VVPWWTLIIAYFLGAAGPILYYWLHHPENGTPPAET
jgi:hypothetical protein